MNSILFCSPVISVSFFLGPVGPAYPVQRPVVPIQGPTYPVQGPVVPMQGPPAYPIQGPVVPIQGPSYPVQGPVGPIYGPSYPIQGPIVNSGFYGARPPVYVGPGQFIPRPGKHLKLVLIDFRFRILFS